jgi:hypothetical protein
MSTINWGSSSYIAEKNIFSSLFGKLFFALIVASWSIIHNLESFEVAKREVTRVSFDAH